MMAICWDHWCPAGWPRVFPFEIFLFFFLVLTGYLITGALLRERDRSEARGGAWKMEALKTYQIRRGLRILAPYYVALAATWLVMKIDVRATPPPSDIGVAAWWYISHLSNIHMAFLGHWPVGSNHFWSLATQQQFYLLWPFVIWWAPRKWMFPAIALFAAAGPVTRLMHDFFLQWCPWPELLTWSSFDYFGIGGLFALAVHRGMSLESPGLRWLAITSLGGYLGIYLTHTLGGPTFGFRAVQQSLLSIALCGFIAAGSVGFSGILKNVLEHPLLQRIGLISYGIYLFHNLAPLLTGKLFWFLWDRPFQTYFGEWLRIGIYAAVTWGLAMASWRWIERPLQDVRTKLGKR
jgi:peptidoglycan/LPS O-acetylase OafA/YrhL